MTTIVIVIISSYVGFILLFFFFGIGVYRFAQFIEAVWISDRRIALIQSAWVYSPVVIASAFWWCGLLLDEVDFQNALPGLGPTFLESALRWLALIMSISWVLVNAPIARLWATNGAENPEAILRAEEYLFVTKTQREIEAQVSIPTYYSLLLSISAMAFLIIEAIIGEMFEHVTGISGFVGAMVATLGVGGLLYPIHRRINAFIGNMREVAQQSGRADALSAVKSTMVSTHKYLSAELGDGIFYVILVLILLGWGFSSLANLS